ncbi:SDR family oxidoreductase [Kineosporia sp. J2-2]|uniref:SDR family oxidoreductase n=1 Tax=Kineosporia corallincola TaxID=2835133 RepID=A0ABS5TI63_9ACTN|nr:hypothetical protein [Kineosporia corallincola]MBT0770791.1 SDR family oxidoreductase [Kineosporia corallincola]
MRDLTGITVLVTGVTRGFGRAAGEALSLAGATVVGVSDDPGAWAARLSAAFGETFVPVRLSVEGAATQVEGAATQDSAAHLLLRHRPRALVLAPAEAGAWARHLPPGLDPLIVTVSTAPPPRRASPRRRHVQVPATAATTTAQTAETTRRIPPALLTALRPALAEIDVGRAVCRVIGRHLSAP